MCDITTDVLKFFKLDGNIRKETDIIVTISFHI